eukprot:625627-Ditylum_brightwellii.AAC.1
MPMKEYEHMNIPIELIPDKIIEQYNLKAIAHNNNIYIKIQKGMYGILQAGHIAHDQLVKHLQKYGYSLCKLTPDLWKHDSQ